jgi:hypothetical protein
MEERGMASYLTQNDLDNFGSEIIDLIQRGSRQAMAPILDRLERVDEALGDQLGREMQLRLHQQVQQAVPDWAAINSDPRWLAWLSQTDPLNGVSRQTLLDRAVQEGRASSVIALFQAFQKEAAAGQPAQSSQPAWAMPNYRPAQPNGRLITRPQILEMAGKRRRGEIDDQTWARWEAELCRASKEGRIANGLNPQTGCQY